MTKINSRGRMADGSSNPIDVFVGQKLCFFRQSRAFSLEQLGRLIGVTFQQMQKYERGKNRISASRLWDLSVVLGISPDDFFEGMDKKAADSSPRILLGAVEGDKIIDPLHQEETIELIEAFLQIKSPDVRRNALLTMVAFSRTTL